MSRGGRGKIGNHVGQTLSKKGPWAKMIKNDFKQGPTLPDGGGTSNECCGEASEYAP